MNKNLLAAVAAGTLLLAANAASAAVQVYDFTVYQAGFSGNLGSVTVTDHGSNTLDFDVVLANNVYFQLTSGNPHDAFWFDLPGLGANTSVSFNISAPNAPGGASGGDYPTGGLFTGGNYGNYGQGFLSNYDYAMRVEDKSNPKQYYGDGDHLTFSVTSDTTPLSIASLGTGQSETVGGHTYNVVFGADLRQCGSQGCDTGPVGAIARMVPPGGVPEPTTWALMIMGFGSIGAMLRRRRSSLAHA